MTSRITTTIICDNCEVEEDGGSNADAYAVDLELRRKKWIVFRTYGLGNGYRHICPTCVDNECECVDGDRHNCPVHNAVLRSDLYGSNITEN